MKVSTTVIKTLLLSLVIAFTGHVLATPEFWFSGTAVGGELQTGNATWYTAEASAVGDVTVTGDVLEIDLPTNTVVKLQPSTPEVNKKTTVVVDNAEFTPTAYNDIDSTVVEGSQTALTVAYDNSSTNYYAYITNNWVKLVGQTPTNTTVDVIVELDYSALTQTNVTFKVDGFTLQDEGGIDTFPITTASTRGLTRIDLAGYGKLHSITSTVEAVANLTIVPGDITYGADFTNVTITATITGEGAADATYTLTWKGQDYSMTSTRVGDTYTLSANGIPFPTTGRESVTYTISATYGGNPAGTSGSATAVVADVRQWVVEDSSNKQATGSWSNNFAYVDTVAPVSDNTYTASSCSTGDLVTITFENITYAELGDLTVETPAGTQGAFALAETNINSVVSTNFCILAMVNENYTWKAATCSVPATTNVAYTVVMTFDYVTRMYSVKVSNETNSGDLNVGGETAFPICVTKTAVTDFVFKGNGTLTAIKGEDCTGYMAKDANNNYWVTIQKAVTEGTGPFTILRATDTNAKYSGWKFDNSDGVWKLVKAAVGMFFFAF